MQAVELTAAALFDYLGIEAASRIRVEKHEGGGATITPLRTEGGKVSARELMGCMKTNIHLSDADIKRIIEDGHVAAGMKGL